MSKKCAKCEKSVYPIEEWKCLDKIWHKGCFKCEVCGMTLNMKNYKGYDKKPYCIAHYPTTKHTQVAETPEMKRIAANTKIQSNLKYHAEAEKERDRYTTIADDPEVRRHMKNTKNISAISYHKDFEEAKGKKISVADDPETERAKKNTETISNVSYHGVRERNLEMEKRRPTDQPVDGGPTPVFLPQSDGYQGYAPQQESVPAPAAPAAPAPQQQPKRGQPGSIMDYDPTVNQHQAAPSPYAAKNTGHRIYASDPAASQPAQSRSIGSIADYDPLNERFGSITQQPYSSTRKYPGGPAASNVHLPPQQSQPARAPQQAAPAAGPMHKTHTAVSKVDFNVSQPKSKNTQINQGRILQNNYPHNYKPFNEQPPLPSPQRRVTGPATDNYWSGRVTSKLHLEVCSGTDTSAP